MVCVSSLQKKQSKEDWLCPSTSALHSSCTVASLQLLAKQLPPGPLGMFHVVGEHWRDRPEIQPVKLNPTNRKLSEYKYSLCFSTWKEIPLSAQSQLKTTMDSVGWAKSPCWEEWVACPGNWIHGFSALWGRSFPIFCKISCQRELLKDKVEHGNSTWLFCSA